MRYYDKEESVRMKIEDWQLDLLNLNPSYVSWGPDEDYMSTSGSGWNSSQIYKTWKEFGPWELDDLNECVNFYFSIDKESKTCQDCEGSGYDPETKRIADTFYSFTNPDGVCWNDKITQEEVQMLIKEGRFPENTSSETVNKGQKGIHSHDAINRILLIKFRSEKLGLPYHCEKCEGHGEIYDRTPAFVSLTLWMIHPRKGCSRGVRIDKIEKDERKEVFDWLKNASERNLMRFDKINKL